MWVRAPGDGVVVHIYSQRVQLSGTEHQEECLQGQVLH